MLGLVLVAMVGGTRPPVSLTMVAWFLFDRFDIAERMPMFVAMIRRILSRSLGNERTETVS